MVCVLNYTFACIHVHVRSDVATCHVRAHTLYGAPRDYTVELCARPPDQQRPPDWVVYEPPPPTPTGAAAQPCAASSMSIGADASTSELLHLNGVDSHSMSGPDSANSSGGGEGKV
jgi:hypothetical protein